MNEQPKYYREVDHWTPLTLETSQRILHIEPVHVDPWHDYSKDKPDKEDFKPLGYVQVVRQNPLDNEIVSNYWNYGQPWAFVSHWRRIRPPEQPKPKSTTAGARTQEQIRIGEDPVVDGVLRNAMDTVQSALNKLDTIIFDERSVLSDVREILQAGLRRLHQQEIDESERLNKAPSQVKKKVHRVCNHHRDCDYADVKAMEKWEVVAEHCYDSECPHCLEQ